MKRIAILSLAAAALLSGCADPNEAVNGEEVQARLAKGVSGQGQLGPINRPDEEVTLPPNQQAQQHP